MEKTFLKSAKNTLSLSSGFLALFLFHSLSYAKSQDGIYIIPTDKPELEAYSEFTSQVTYSGGDLVYGADEFTVHFPATITGVKNEFVIVKNAKGEWVGDPQLFEEFSCQVNTEFTCLMKFRKEALVEESEHAEGLFKNSLVSSLLAVNTPKLGFNRSLAIQNLTNAGVVGPDLQNTLLLVDQFKSEPIGILKYAVK